VEDFNKTNTFGALLYGRQSHGWGVARYDRWGATYSGRDLQFYRDIDKPASCQWSGSTFIGCSAIDQDFLDMATELDQVKPKIVLVHWRTGSSGCSGATHVNVHPFFEDYDGKTWSFVQNGGVDKPRTKWLIVDGNPNEEDNDWTNNIPTGSGIEGCTSDRGLDPFGNEIGSMVDSELYFKLIMKHIKEAHLNGGTTLGGIVKAIMRLVNHFESGGINFLMSDGYTLWGFKRGNRLSYRYNETSGFCDIATNQLTGFKLDENNDPVETGFNNEGWANLNEYEIVICAPGAAPVVFDIRDLIPGNLNGDTVVDEEDRIIFLNALGSRSGDPEFNKNADYDGNGRITKKDDRIWKEYHGDFINAMLCDDHMNSATGCCRSGYLYGEYDIDCGATYLPLTGAAGAIELGREVDYFRFSAIAGNQYTIETGGDQDTYLYLYDKDGQSQIASNDDFGGSGLSQIVWDCPSSGTYYSMVRLYSSYSTGDYTLSLNVPYFIPVKIDIKQGKHPKCFKDDGKGHILVAILSDPDSGFDAAQVDPSTVSLIGLGVEVKGKKNELQAKIKDVNHDGYDDLEVKIDKTAGAFREGTTEAEVIGALLDGTLIEGADSICIKVGK
jgi:hypothetical protein